MPQLQNRYEITVENCTSFEKAEIVVDPGSLNIKYGSNGLGKSSIARAIEASARGDGSLERLKPFKHRGADGSPSPTVTGAEQINSVLLFDERYVQQFVFQKDEVVAGSFEVFVKTDEYVEAMEATSELLEGVRKNFSENEELDTAISDLTQLAGAFSFTKKGELSKSSKGYKALDAGNKIENIPEELAPYTDFLKAEKRSPWIAWQKKGNAFLEISENCPYCSSSLASDGKKATPLLIEKHYDSKSIDHLSAIQTAIDHLGEYFSEDCHTNLNDFINGKTRINDVAQAFLVNLTNEIDALVKTLEKLRALSFYTFRDLKLDEVDEWIKGQIIDLTKLPNLHSVKTKSVTDPINTELETLLEEIGSLKGKIGKQKSKISQTILTNQTLINDFLQSAGYRYRVEITPDQDSYKMRLLHIDYAGHIENATEHLSYGERNAFSLILFMYQALSQKPDLVVLDDPISSFDNNKKFAIIHQLFRGNNSFKGMTVLMLTHDIEPAIDMIRVNGVRDRFQASHPNASFLQSKDGIVSERSISRSDLKTFTEVCEANISSDCDEIIKLIYLRRLHEIIDFGGEAYQLISNVLHGEQTPFIRSRNADTGEITEVDMTAEQITSAVENIKRYLPDFSYANVVSRVKDELCLRNLFATVDAGYEKLQVFRMICETTEETAPNDIIKKFINETFHIENDYVMQLNPREFDPIPEYVINECSRILGEHSG